MPNGMDPFPDIFVASERMLALRTLGPAFDRRLLVGIYLPVSHSQRSPAPEFFD